MEMVSARVADLRRAWRNEAGMCCATDTCAEGAAGGRAMITYICEG